MSLLHNKIVHIMLIIYPAHWQTDVSVSLCSNLANFEHCLSVRARWHAWLANLQEACNNVICLVAT